jgi:mannose/cellobiose epimerase-like protein (N-acyl-D-glucosamine 2-epimerase family)
MQIRVSRMSPIAFLGMGNEHLSTAELALEDSERDNGYLARELVIAVNVMEVLIDSKTSIVDEWFSL